MGAGDACRDPRERDRRVVGRMVSDHRALLDNSSAPVDPAVQDAVLNDFPLQSVCDARERTDDCFIFVATALENICIYHPFADGNKRAALATALRIFNAGDTPSRTDWNSAHTSGKWPWGCTTGFQ